MKKTLTINLGGMVYHIDEDAYFILKDYLEKVESELKEIEGSSEILEDIERRFGELLTGKMKQGKQVVTIDDIEEIIKIMGRPEDISGSGEQQKAQHDKKKYRRMYRDVDNRMLGGVCSGMAAYWNIDPVLVRIAFVILAFFVMAGILVYLLLWLILPEATTIAQKLEMRGEDVTLSGIKDFFVEEFENVKRSFRKK